MVDAAILEETSSSLGRTLTLVLHVARQHTVSANVGRDDLTSPDIDHLIDPALRHRHVTDADSEKLVTRPDAADHVRVLGPRLIRHENNEAALTRHRQRSRQKPRDVTRGGRVLVCSLRAREKELDMVSAVARRQRVIRSRIAPHETETVPPVGSEIGENIGGPEGDIAFAFPRWGCGQHVPPSIEDELSEHIRFSFEATNDRVAGTSRRFPVDRGHVVTGTVVDLVIEVDAVAGEYGGMMTIGVADCPPDCRQLEPSPHESHAGGGTPPACHGVGTAAKTESISASVGMSAASASYVLIILCRSTEYLNVRISSGTT